MAYAPTFERNPKGNFDIDNNYVSIHSGSESYLLEDELNELQWIQYEQKSQSMRSIITSGIIYNAPLVLNTEENTSIDNALYIKSFNNHDINTNTILLSIKNYIPINLNGYVFKLCGTYNKNISGELTTNKNILIDLYDGSNITGGTKNELVYLEMWFENINSIENNQINKYGGISNDYDEFENDERLKLETTRRIQLKWAIKSKIDCDNLSDISPINNDNKKYIQATSTNGQNYSNDKNLYVCDIKLNSREKSIDNMYYAIPLFLIKRKSDQILLNDVIPLYQLSNHYIAKFDTNELTFGTQENITLKNVSGNGLELKNSDNTEYIDLKLKNLTGELVETKQVLSNEIKINDPENNKTSKLINDNGNLKLLDDKNVLNSGYGDLTIGNLFVKGKSTIVESETVTIADNIILLNSDISSTTTPTQDSGIEINRGSSVAASLIWDENLDAWTAGLLNSEDTIILKTSPTITTPTIEKTLTIKNSTDSAKINLNSSNNIFELNAYNIGGTSLYSSIVLDANDSNKLWSIKTGNINNKIATINQNNVLCNNIGGVARTAMANGTSKPTSSLAKGDNVLFIDYQHKKIYFDSAQNTWIEVGRPADVADCDSNFHYDSVSPTGTTRLNYNGYFYATRVYNAVYNDFAEYFEKGDKTVEPGDVVVCSDENDNEYVKSNGAYNNLVVGVCSDSYGHILGGEGKESDDDNFIPLGLSGRVRVKVIGDIKKGDLLVTSDIPGVAMKSDKYVPGTVIGKALESHTGHQINRIKMLIMNI